MKGSQKMARFQEDEEGVSRPDKKHSTRGLPWIYEPKCSICRSTNRKAIDQMLVAGFSLRSIAEHFERLGETFTRASLSRHGRKHVTLQSAAIRRIIEKRAEDMVDSVEEAAGFLATRRSILEVAMQKGYDQIMSGSAHISPQDLLAIMDKLERMEAEEHAVAVDEMMRDFNAFAQAVKAMVEEEKWPEIVALYKENLQDMKTPALEDLIQIGPGYEIEDIAPQDVEFEDEG